jgi:hypothetical protein
MSKTAGKSGSTPSLYDVFKTNEEIEKSGITVDFGVCQIFIRRAGGSNKEFQACLRANLKPFKYQIDKGLIDDDDPRYKDAFKDAFIRHVVIGWEGNVDGQNSPYSIELAKKVMTDLPDVYSELLIQSTKAANFRHKEVSDQAKK